MFSVFYHLEGATKYPEFVESVVAERVKVRIVEEGDGRAFLTQVGRGNSHEVRRE
jgi:hypothetical protein